MFWGKKQEVSEDSAIPPQVALAYRVIELLESRPGTVTKHTRNESTAGQDFAATGEYKEDYLEAPTALTHEQKSLQAAACAVVNLYLSAYLADVMAPSEDV